MPGYTDYCPIAVGVDIVGDRWTPLVIRELMVGAQGFNEIHRGIPRVSRTLLAQRLRHLERHGLVVREAGERGRAGRYALTPAGEALTPLIWSLGRWAAEWIFEDRADQSCNGLALLWRLHQKALPDKLPADRTIVQLVLTGDGASEGWLCLEPTGVTVCKDDPGYDVDLAVEADTRALQRWLIGLVPFRDLISAGQARMLGPSRLARAFPGWFDTSAFTEGFRRADQRHRDEALPA